MTITGETKYRSNVRHLTLRYDWLTKMDHTLQFYGFGISEGYEFYFYTEKNQET